MPTGTPKTDAEKRADALLEAIEKNARELHQLVYAGQADARKIEKVRAELGAPVALNGFSGTGSSAPALAPVKDGK